MIQGYSRATKSKIKRIIANVQGKEKRGKTHFALTAPGPIALIDMDIGLEGVVDKFIGEKEIVVAGFNYRNVKDPKEWEEMNNRMKKAFTDALKSKEVRTVVMDTATEAWELMRMANFGKLSEVKPHHYGPVNAEFRDLIRKAYESDKNVLLIHKVKKEYVNDKSTGEYERAGFGDAGYLMQLNVEMWKKDGTFGLTVLDCRQLKEVEGLELIEPMSNFPFLATQVFDGTAEEDWS